MSGTAISALGLSKQYQIGRRRPAQDSLRDVLVDSLVSWRRSAARSSERGRPIDRIWALDDVSFDIKAGEIVGIVGANGSGKSTLLKVLSRITTPTRGRATIHGRVGSLIEVGTGFHPDLTGRDNVFLNGVILGMRRSDVAARFDEIVEFAGIAPFIDTPVKRYSSGMYLRLAFAVAAHLETDVLLVDEVLAVGDVAFQQKCLGKVRLIASAGRTVLFVSHNMVAVEDLCGRAIWLDHGRIAADAGPRAAIGEYLRRYTNVLPQQVWTDMSTAPGNDTVRLKTAGVRPWRGGYGDVIDVATEFVIELEYWHLSVADLVTVSVFVCRDDGLVIFNTGTLQPRPRAVGLYKETGRVPANLMNDGFYTISIDIVHDQTSVYRHSNVLAFHVADRPDLRAGWFGEWPGAVRPILDWRTEQLTVEAAPNPQTRLSPASHDRHDER